LADAWCGLRFRLTGAPSGRPLDLYRRVCYCALAWSQYATFGKGNNSMTKFKVAHYPSARKEAQSLKSSTGSPHRQVRYILSERARLRQTLRLEIGSETIATGCIDNSSMNHQPHGRSPTETSSAKEAFHGPPGNYLRNRRSLPGLFKPCPERAVVDCFSICEPSFFNRNRDRPRQWQRS